MATIKEIALKFRNELLENPTEDNATRIAQKINKLKNTEGGLLSQQSKELILTFIEDPSYNPKTGQRMILESDNSKFLNLVAIINSNIKKETK